MKNLVVLFFILVLVGCDTKPKELKPGQWMHPLPGAYIFCRNHPEECGNDK